MIDMSFLWAWVLTLAAMMEVLCLVEWIRYSYEIITLTGLSSEKSLMR